MEGPSLLLLLWLIRDARSTKGAARHLLMALALRCNPKQRYSCWPSYSMLAQDTQLDEVTLKRAAAKLEDAKLIHRVVRKNRSNRWYINVALLQQQANAVMAAKKAEDDAEECIFDAPETGNKTEADDGDDAMDSIYGGGR